MSDMRKTTLKTPSDHEMVFTRIFDAPRDLVWRAWTDPNQLAQWWGPDGFRLTTHHMEFHQDGVWKFTMHGPDGRDYKNQIIYLEIAKPDRIVYRHVGEEGDEPVKFQTTVIFKAVAENLTELIMHMTFATAAELQFVVQNYAADDGAMQTIGRLATHLATLRHSHPQK